MAFSIPELTDKKLKALDATYKCFAQSTPIDNKVFKVEVICKITGRVFAEGFGNSKLEALVEAVNNANPDDKPKTPSELAEENAALRKQLLAAMGGNEIRVEGKPTRSLSAELTNRAMKNQSEPTAPAEVSTGNSPKPAVPNRHSKSSIPA